MSAVQSPNFSYLASLRSHLGYKKSTRGKTSGGSLELDLISSNDNVLSPDEEFMSYTHPLKPQSRSRYREADKPSVKDPKLIQAPTNASQVQPNQASSNVPVVKFSTEPGFKHSNNVTNVPNSSITPILKHNKTASTRRTTPPKPKTQSGSVVKFSQPPNLNVLIKRGKFKGIYDDRQSKCIYNHLLPAHASSSFNHSRCVCKSVPIVQSPLKITYTASNVTKKLNSVPNSAHKFAAEDGTVPGRFRTGHLLTRVKQRLTESRVMGSDYEHFIFEKMPRNIKKTPSFNNMRSFRSNTTSLAKPIHEEGNDNDSLISDIEDAETVISELTEDFSTLTTAFTNLTEEVGSPENSSANSTEKSTRGTKILAL
ncbi:hypothetical protein WICPIJ_006006 [Wickerhamomyces pijperi]|uniref:Uncharacterized protein n=1 Tax=Wickerhamomyces pijperi TaxID=599730 RepID=A0A9P8Q4N0_WICPI|nr:hypothetical protein WICPIJ_006006 [Wickerhamomyces pijperi]